MENLTCDGERARRVIKRSMPRVMGRFPSFKSDRSIHWESQLERDFVCRLEFDPAVIRYREQPVTLQFELDGKPCRYTPDFLAERIDGRYVFEVKPRDALRKPDLRRRLDRAEEILAAQGVIFRVVTEDDIRTRPALDNIRLLLRYQRLEVPDAACESVRAILRERGPLSFGDLADAASGLGIGRDGIYALLCRHVLAADLSLPLKPPSLIHLAQGG